MIDKNAEVKRELARLGIEPRKTRGQNFLLDESVCSELIELVGVSREMAVVEVGPGMGVLTNHLFQRVPNLVAIELEPDFCRALRERFAQFTSENLICADVRQVSLEPFFRSAGKKLTVVGNIPYSISTDLIFWLFEQQEYVERACFLFQREFAERIAAGGGVRASGVISLMCEMHASAELGAIVSGESFYPPAKVESRLVALRLRPHPRLSEIDPKRFRTVVRAAFSKRRKTLVNSLNGSELGLAKEQILLALKNANIDPIRRAETLTFDEFVDLTKAVA